MFGALASLQLAFWPELAGMRDDSAARWAFGLFANAWLVGLLVVATLLSKQRKMAGLTLLCLALAGVFTFVRFPDVEIKYWLIEHWPVMFAVIAPICLGLSRLARRGPWRPFLELLEVSALVVFPATALTGTIVTSLSPVARLLGKIIYYDVTTLRASTWIVLAVHFAFCARVLGRRALYLASAVLLVGLIVSMVLRFGVG